MDHHLSDQSPPGGPVASDTNHAPSQWDDSQLCASRPDPKLTPTAYLTSPLLSGLSYLASPLPDRPLVFLHLDNGSVSHLATGDLAFLGSCFNSPFRSAVRAPPDTPRSSLLVVCLPLDSVLSLPRLAPATVSNPRSRFN